MLEICLAYEEPLVHQDLYNVMCFPKEHVGGWSDLWSGLTHGLLGAIAGIFLDNSMGILGKIRATLTTTSSLIFDLSVLNIWTLEHRLLPQLLFASTVLWRIQAALVVPSCSAAGDAEKSPSTVIWFSKSKTPTTWLCRKQKSGQGGYYTIGGTEQGTGNGNIYGIESIIW